MRHQDLIINHRLESWVYANAAARTGATGLVPGDVARVAYQTDTGQYWRLTDDSPVTWQIIALPAYASLQTTPASPTGSTSTIGVMMGMGSTWNLIPVATGKIFVTVSGQLSNDTLGAGAVAQIRYGTIPAPANQAALTGTPIGSFAQRGGASLGANVTEPFALSALITGLALGASTWLDISLISGPASTATALSISLAAVELP